MAYSYQYRKIAKRLKAGEGTCYICGVRLVPGEGEIDHIIPLSERPDLECDLGNMARACRTCNRSKKDRVTTQKRGVLPPLPVNTATIQP